MQDAGKHVPALENRPNIIGLTWLWNAFWELSTCRAFGTVAGPIPWTAIHAYSRAHRLNSGEDNLLHTCIRHMDNIWLNHNNEIAQREAKRRAKTSEGRHGSR